MRLLLFALLLASLASATEKKAINPGGVKPVGPYSPGVLAGDYLYVSGQGARDEKNQLPPTVEGQTRQCLANVKAIVEAAGMKMDNVVYTQLYLSNIADYETVNRIWPEYFPAPLPARQTLAVARMPTGTPIEINAIAYRDAAKKQPVQLPGSRSPVPISPAMLLPDRLYLSGILGRDADSGVIPATQEAQISMAFDRARRVLAAAGMDFRNLTQLNVYLSPQLERSTFDKVAARFLPKKNGPSLAYVHATALAFGVNVGLTGTAARDRKARRNFGPCVSMGDTAWCTGEAGTVQASLMELSQRLQAGGFVLPQSVANIVYIPNLDDFAVMNKDYATRFGDPLPTRTTIEPARSQGQVSVIAVR
jgi:reactive intermediate/imine deaminase